MEQIFAGFERLAGSIHNVAVVDYGDRVEKVSLLRADLLNYSFDIKVLTGFQNPAAGKI